MSRDRLNELESHLELLYQQKVALEQKALLTADALAATQAQQQLKKTIQPKIHDYETEKWQLLATEANSLNVTEAEAETAIAEIVEAETKLEQAHTYPDEVLTLLREILAKLDEPGTTASGKLKGVLSSFPPFVGVLYEAELDTENVLRTYFPTFSALISKALKRSANP